MTIETLGIDIAKNVFQLHGVNCNGRAILKRRVMRDELLRVIAQIEPCTIVLEACTGAFCLARKFEVLEHKVKLISPQYVKPFVRRQKNDGNDAEAICTAGRQPHSRADWEQRRQLFLRPLAPRPDRALGPGRLPERPGRAQPYSRRRKGGHGQSSAPRCALRSGGNHRKEDCSGARAAEVRGESRCPEPCRRATEGQVAIGSRSLPISSRPASFRLLTQFRQPRAPPDREYCEAHDRDMEASPEIC